MRGFICPFCHLPLPPLTFGFHECFKCGVAFDANLRIARFQEAAPEHYKETFKFMQTFLENKPLFAMSPVKMFEEGFNANDVLYYTSNTSLKRIVKPSQVEKNHLVAGNGLFAKGLLRSVVYHYDTKSKISPLTPVFESAENWLFYYIMLMSVKCSLKVPIGLHAYLQPTVEGMSNILLHMPHHPMSSLTDEQVLYSAIFAQPQNNIEWSTSNLEERVRAYLKALTDVTPNTKYLPFVFEENVTNFPEIFVARGESKTLYDIMLKGNVGTAANQGLTAFDILEKSYAKLNGPGSRMTSRQLNVYLDALKITSALFDKYAKDITPMGIEEKRKYLKPEDPQETPDDVVMSFWSRVNLELGGGGFLV